MNALTGNLINCINNKHSGNFVLRDGSTVSFALIQGIDGKTNAVTYIVKNVARILSLDADKIAQVQIDVDEIKVDGAEVVLRSAALRGAGRFDEAISLIEGVLDKFDPDTRLIGLIEVFHAVRQMNNSVKAKEYAKLIAEEEPDFPGIQDYLD